MQRRQCKLPLEVQRELLRLFSKGWTARQAARELELNRHSVTLYFLKVREIIFEKTAAAKRKKFKGNIVVSARKQDHLNAACDDHGITKRPVLSVFHHGAENYLLRMNQSQFGIDPILPSLPPRTRHKRYIKVTPNTLILAEPDQKMGRLRTTDFVEIPVHENSTFDECKIFGPAQFWSETTQLLDRLGGIPKTNLHLFIAEYEWRFNYKHLDLHRTLSSWVLSEARISNCARISLLPSLPKF